MKFIVKGILNLKEMIVVCMERKKIFKNVMTRIESRGE